MLNRPAETRLRSTSTTEPPGAAPGLDGASPGSFSDRSETPLASIERATFAAIDRFGSPVYALVLLAYVAMAAAGAWFLTVEVDEAWILLSTMNAFGLPLPDTSAIAHPTVASGGIHTLIHGVVATATGNILVHRMVSVLFGIILLAIVFATLRSGPASRVDALAGTALFAAVPGFFLQAGLATAEIIAITLLLLAFLHWVRFGCKSLLGSLITGVLLGLACATRINCVTAMPAILFCALVFCKGRDRKFLFPIACLAIGLAVLAASMLGYIVAAGIDTPSAFKRYLASSTGVGADAKDIAKIVRFIIIGNDFIPMILLAATWGAYFAATGPRLAAEARQLCGSLLVAGTIGWLAWIWKAPLPHVRYLWPAIPALWLAGIVLAINFLQRSRDAVRLAFHGVTIAVCAYQGLASLALISHGESLTLVYQLNRMAPLITSNDVFGAGRDQRDLSAFVAGLPASATVYAIAAPAAYPITYLGGKAIHGLLDARGFAGGSRYLLASPADFATWRPSHEFVIWRNRYAPSVFRSGDYAVFRIREDAPLPRFNVSRVGHNDIFPPSSAN